MSWAENIYFSSQGFTLDVPSFDFLDEGVTCIWGASGAGKSTFLQCLAGLIDQPSFKMSVREELVTELPLKERNIGFVFQDFALFPHMTVLENITFAAKSKSIPENLIARLSLQGLIDQKASHLSGGEQQRVAIARALVTKPRMLLLDEPLSALDEKMRDEARLLIYDLSREYRVPFILVTHDLRDVRAIGSSILVLANGSPMGFGKTEVLLTDPPNLELAKLIPENQVLDFKIRNGKFYLANYEFSKVRIKPGSSNSIVAKNWSFETVLSQSVKGLFLEGQVLESTDIGPYLDCHVRLSDNQTVRAFSELNLNQVKKGTPVDLKVDESSIILFKEDL